MHSLSLSFTLLSAALLAGCSGFQTTATTPISSQSAAIAGTVHGGQQAVSGSHIYLFAAALNSTYGAASASLLTPGSLGVFPDTSNRGYVLTDLNGNFSITGDYTCPAANPPVYLLALGGNPGIQPITASNSAISLMAMLGPCSSINSSTLANINEVTTVAAATTLQQFFADPVHLGTSISGLTGLNNAAANATNIVDRASGFARPTSLLGNGAVPQSKIHALGNILAPCINSAGPASTQCASLFSQATYPGGATPSDVATAMLYIAQNPGVHVSNLFNLIDANAPFQPSLSTAPNDFTIGVTYTGGGLTAPGDVVIDSLGNAWTANCPNCTMGSGTDSIVGFGPQGSVLSGGTGFTANVHLPQGIAIDEENAIWGVSDASGALPDQVVRFNSNGNVYPGFPFTSSYLTSPSGIAINASSNAVVVSSGGNPSAILTVTNTGGYGGAITPLSPCGLYGADGVAIDPSGNIYVASAGFNAILKQPGPTCYRAGLNAPIGIAIDHSGNLWTVDNGSNSISEISTTTGLPVAGSPFPGGYQFAVLAIAGDGSVWFANCKAGCPGSGAPAGQPDNVIHISAAGAYVTSTNGYQDTHFNGVGVAAIDGSGNVWVSNSNAGSLTELLGVAAPAVTPIAVASRYNLLGVRP